MGEARGDICPAQQIDFGYPLHMQDGIEGRSGDFDPDAAAWVDKGGEPVEGGLQDQISFGALAADVPLAATAAGLEAFEPVKGRSRALCLTLAGRELTVVDDTYNANPDSVRAAIDVLAELPGPRLLVLGDMGEVGDQGPEFHAEAGAHARACGIDALFCLGEQTRQAVRAFGDARHFDDVEALNAAVLAYLPGASSVLVKGSRFMKMERVVQAMQAAQTFTAEVADAH